MEAARKIDVDVYAVKTPEGTLSHKSPDGTTVESGTVFGRDISTQSPEEKSASLPKSSANPLCQTLEGLTITRVGHPERFVAHPDMLGLEYLEEPGLDVKEVCKRIKQVRKGRINGQYEDEGLIYCKYVRDQQSALEQLGKAVEKNPVEVIFTMERGGTCLYDFLETYIPPVSRPAVVVSTAKEMELSSARHIEKMSREVDKAFHLGYRRIGVAEVSISGMQLHAIVKKLAECIDSLPDQNVEVHCFVLRQALSKRPYDQKERETKLHKLLEQNPAIHVHVVETPFLLGEDVEQYLRYGSENQHPVNLVLPDRSLWQLHSHGGTRQTLKNLVAGKYNSFVPGLCSGASEPSLIPHRTIDSADLVKTVSEEKQLCSGWGPGRCFDYILENGWDAVPDEVNGKPQLSFHVNRERISNLKHWLEEKARDVDEKFRGMAPNEYMTHCQVEFDSLEVQELKPVLLKLCSQLAYHGQLDMTATFRRHRKKLLNALPLAEKLAAPKSNTHSKTPVISGAKNGVAKFQSIDLVKEGVSLLEAADKVINGKLTPRYDANVSNFLNNKLTIFINNLSSQIVSDDLCDADRSKLMDILNSVKRALLPVLKSMDKSKQAVKNKKTAEELSEVVDNCLTLPGPESASETTRRCFLNLEERLEKAQRKQRPVKEQADAEGASGPPVAPDPFMQKLLRLGRYFMKPIDPGFTKQLIQRLSSQSSASKEVDQTPQLHSHTQVRVHHGDGSESKLNAHRVSYDGRLAGIAMKGPVPSEMPNLFRMIEQENIGLVLDLIHDDDRAVEKGRGRFNWDTVSDLVPVRFGDEYSIRKLNQETVEFRNPVMLEGEGEKKIHAVLRTLNLKGPEGERIIRQISFPGWTDLKQLPFEVMEELI